MSTISSTSKKRLAEQGFRGFSDSEISQHRFGIRFAYFTCGSLVLAGLVFKIMPLLFVALGVAFLGMLLPNHPFDYPYNGLVRHLVKRPRLPRRAVQARFACTMATIMLSGIIYLFYEGFDLAAYLLGAGLLTSATLVSVFDICIPSKIYNALFERGGVKQEQAA